MPLRLAMMGTGTFAEPTLLALLASPHPVVGLVTQPDPDGGGHRRGSTRQVGRGMKEIAQERGIAVFQPESVNTPEGVEGLRAFRPDLLVVAAYGQILSPQVLEVPSLGGINVHASLLPKYRGAAPVAWAICHGETHSGVTIIRMSPRLDAGEMLAQEALDILPDETAGELETRLATLGARLAADVVKQFAAGPVSGTVQDSTKVTKAPKLKKEHGAINWIRHGRDVCNHVRAMQPWPTPYTFLHRQGHPAVRVILNRGTWDSRTEGPEKPGDVLPGEPGRLRIAAGEQTLVEVLELQPAGKRRMSAAEFLRGHPVQPGDRLGPELP